MSLTKQIEQAEKLLSSEFNWEAIFPRNSSSEIAMRQFLTSQIAEAYKKGFIDGHLEVYKSMQDILSDN